MTCENASSGRTVDKMGKVKPLALCALAAASLLLCACVSSRPVLNPAVTLAPTPTPAPTVTPTPTPSPAPPPTLTPPPQKLVGGYDALGILVASPEHYEQYLTFQNIQVYEQFDDTFMDALAVNSYPEPLVCAVDIVFEEGGETVASGKLQTQDGQYVLILQPGENTVYAQINTDMTLTLMDFTLEYDEGLGVWPK